MNSDVFFTGTKAHRVCQDYGRASRVFGKTYAIVSDGCSSSPDTDVGARFLTLAAAKVLGEQREWTVAQAIVDAAARMVCPPLMPSCLDATLLVACEAPQGVRVDVAGDGIVAGRRRENKQLVVFEFDYRNVPAYLSYLRDAERRAIYLQEGCGERTIRVWRLSAGDPVAINVYHDNPFTGKADYPADNIGLFYTCLFPKDEYDLVVLCTDGVSAFQQKDTLDSIPFYKILSRLTAFPSFTGEFVTRRVRRFLAKECVQLEWVQNDDLGVGAIHMESTENENRSEP